MKDQIPSRRSHKKATPAAHVPPGAPLEDEPAPLEVVTPVSLAPNPFRQIAPETARRTSLAGRYRVREGYTVAHPNGKLDFATGQYMLTDPKDGSVQRHATAKPGEIVELSHDDAVSVIRHTKDQRHPVTGRANGPAIETETAYLSRTAAEAEHARFMAEVNGVNALDALDS